MTAPVAGRAAAARLLGVAPDADPGTVRRAFRARVRHRHPDRVGTDPRAHDDTTELIAAYDLLRRPVQAESGPSDRPAPSPDPTPGMSMLADGTLVLDASVEEAFLALVEAGHAVGDMTHVDPEAGLFEILVTLGDRPCSVVVSLQGRMDSVEAWCTLDVLDGGPRPSVSPVVDALAEALSRT